MQEVQKYRRISSNVSPSINGRQCFRSKRKQGAPQTAHPEFQESRNDFLKERIPSLPSKDQEELPIELDEEISMQFMYDTMSNYLGLLKKKFEYQLTGNFRIDICSLYSEFISYLQKETYADINLANEWDENSLELYLYHYPNAFRDEFVFLPISIVEKMPEYLGTLFLDFVGFYYKTQQVSIPEENDYFSYVIDFEANIGRQLFSESDIGLNKANVLITRTNRFFGIDWECVPELYGDGQEEPENIIISCVDSVKSRLLISNAIEGKSGIDYRRRLYWLDFGNGTNFGQVVLGTLAIIGQPQSKKYEVVSKLKTVAELFDLGQVNEKDSGPSCSLAEALRKQDLFINSTLSQLGCALLWKLITNGMIDYQGVYLNLDTMNVNPIKL